MFKFCSLYSGSTGNSLFVQTENTKILVDAGVSGKKIVEALESKDIDIKDIDSILVTHEHMDHIKSINVLSNKYDIPVYATLKTWRQLDKKNINISTQNRKIFKISEKFSIKDLKINPFKTPHDAIDSCGFSFENLDKKKITIATDLGHIESQIYSELEDSDFVLLEANYELELLKMGKYPDFLKQRIAGDFGHLSNTDTGNVVAKLIKKGLSNVMLGHLSKENNFPELAKQTVIEQINKEEKLSGNIDINVASRLEPSEFINV